MGLSAGTEVHVLERAGDRLTVEADLPGLGENKVKFTISKFDVTRDLRVARQFAVPANKRGIEPAT